MNKESWHQSQRGYFAGTLYEQMKTDKDIWLVCFDLGYKVFDKHFETFPDRCINTGASEQAGMDICVGLAMGGKKPFAYSIAPFLIYRPFETIRTYINHEQVPVRLVGSGRDQDYKHDGFSHDASDVKRVLSTMDNIYQYYPMDKELVPSLVQNMVELDKPQFISLQR